MSYRVWKLFSAVIPIVATFLPHDGGAAHSQNVPCRPNATGTLLTFTDVGPPGPGDSFVAQAQQENKNQEKQAQPTEINTKIVFSDLRNPKKNFTPLFGEVPKKRTHTERQEQASCDDKEFERCVPQTT